jgi:hypothetical protein
LRLRLPRLTVFRALTTLLQHVLLIVPLFFPFACACCACVSAVGGFLMPARPRKKPTLQTVLKEEHSYIGAFESKMSRAEAALILGAIESDKNNILIRYKQLMKITHPDRGGSAYLSSKVNEAKDLLMQEEGMEAGHKQQK